MLGKRSSGGTALKEDIMRADIHPKYEEMTATCSCGNVVKTRSTLGKDMHLDVCSACHPFYTGKQKMLDSGGRVDRFRKRFGARGTKAEA
ncbi:MAG: large subunit ribosomal protein L31 [Pseudohongiellaceae bacterium]